MQVHHVVHPLKEEKQKRKEEREGTRTQHMPRTTAKIHYIGYQTDIHAIQEIPMAMLGIAVLVADAAQVYLPYPALLQPADGLPYIVLIELPEVGKVIHYAIGNQTEHDTVADGSPFLHQAVNSIVECRIASEDNDGL